MKSMKTINKDAKDARLFVRSANPTQNAQNV